MAANDPKRTPIKVEAGTMRMIAFGMLLFAVGSPPNAQGLSRPPWRSNDATIIQLCFDSLDRSAPSQLMGQQVTDAMVATARAELVGFTLADRPIYEVGLAHPLKFRTFFVQLPGTSTWARIDSPDFLESTIAAWRWAPTPNVCTNDEGAPYTLVRGGRISNTVDCPQLGLSVSFKVLSQGEFSATRALARPRGPVLYNGLKGCKESVYGPK